MRGTRWPCSCDGRYEVPDGWSVYFIGIPCGKPLYKFPNIHQEHYDKFDEIVKWIYTNIRDVEETMWWDIDGDQMYFSFKHAADQTWFILRWS
jgi:hypothetical protein